jgi:hypothetical protein
MTFCVSCGNNSTKQSFDTKDCLVNYDWIYPPTGSPEEAFEDAETQLKFKAAELGCDYVINAVFNQRVAVG